MKIERFEDIEGWQKARVLAQIVYQKAIQAKKLINGFIRYLRKS